MTRKNHSIGLKLFIFLLVAMMLFSAIGVMVIYLNVPTATPTTTTLPSDPTITLPPMQPTTGTDAVLGSGEVMIDAEVLVDEAPTEPAPTDEIVPTVQAPTDEQAPTEQAVPEEEINAEPTPAPAQ